MAKAKQAWLFKQEPGCYSLGDLQRDGQTAWDGVSNALALKHLRAVADGDRILFYHTGKEKAVVGEMRAVGAPEADPNDPKAVVVTVGKAKAWPRPVTLAEIKADPALQDWALVRMPRLSVMPVTPDQWDRLERLAEAAP